MNTIADPPPGSIEPHLPANRIVYGCLFLCAFAAPLIYAAATHEVWEDYLITFRFSRNLARGMGLTYNPPEHVYGFTSPLGVLVPALFQWMAGAADFHVALNWFRVLSAGAFAAAVLLVFDTLRRSGHHRIGVWFSAIFMLIEPKCLAYSSNGQEAAFMMLGVAALIRLSIEPIARRWIWWGIVLGFLQWTRPDGFVYGGAIALASLVFSPEPKKTSARGMIKAAALALLIHLPWIVVVCWYYGNPIPHTIIAKSVLTKVLFPAPLWAQLLNLPERIAGPYQPIYGSLGGWPIHVKIFAGAIGLIAACAWLLPPGRDVDRYRSVRVASLGFLILSFYFCVIGIDAPWYYPPFALTGLAVFAPAVVAICARVRPGWIYLAGGMLGLIAVERAVYATQFVRQIATQQRIIEEGTRIPVGLFIQRHAAPGDHVFLEPLGYIGFFSDAVMLDYPGLVAPQVTRYLTPPVFRFDEFLEQVRPEWLVFRLDEAQSLGKDPHVSNDYSLMQVFDSTAAVDAADICGKPLLQYDQTFLVYRRKSK